MWQAQTTQNYKRSVQTLDVSFFFKNKGENISMENTTPDLHKGNIYT